MTPDWIENTAYFFGGVAFALAPVLIGAALAILDARALRKERRPWHS